MGSHGTLEKHFKGFSNKYACIIHAHINKKRLNTKPTYIKKINLLLVLFLGLPVLVIQIANIPQIGTNKLDRSMQCFKYWILAIYWLTKLCTGYRISDDIS